jgi:hypothetical protein
LQGRWRGDLLPPRRSGLVIGRSREWSRIWRNGFVSGAVTKEQINRGKTKSAIMKVAKGVFSIIRNARDAENGFKL